MADKTEYIFEKDFWGNWKFVPKKQDNSFGWFILLLIVLFILCLVIVTLPLWIALLGFKMVKTKRYYAGIGSLLALLYFIIDIQNSWITGFLFLGYNDSAGKFTEGLIGEKQIMYVYIANGIGVLLGLYFIVQAYLINKENNALNDSTSESETTSDNSQSSNDFGISTSEPKSSSNYVNLVLGILGVVFAITVIYFSFNKKVVNNEEPVINEKPINKNPNNALSEQEYNEPISQDQLLNFITQYYIDISSNNFEAENYFSNNVTQYITRKNVSPYDINTFHKNNEEYINENSTIIDNEINLDRTEGEINYYNYWIDFNCFRKSKNKYQKCKVKVEIGIDDKNKIKSYRELEVTNLEFTNAEYPIKAESDNNTITDVDNQTYVIVEKYPGFVGGDIEFYNYLSSSIIYPSFEKEARISGRCSVRFIVEKDGSISNVELIRGIVGGENCNEEALRVIKTMPKWIPGESNGKKVRVSMIYPVYFKLE